MTHLDSLFYHRDTRVVAQELLGCRLIRRIADTVCSGIIVETESYRQDDPASHSHRGPTRRNRSMFGPPGQSYVYLIYGIHHCLNVVTEAEGIGGAVLIRAVKPTEGIHLLARNRFPENTDQIRKSLRWAQGENGGADGRVPQAVRNIAGGPGKLCAAFAIDRTLDAVPLDSDTLALSPPPHPVDRTKIATSVRVGVREEQPRFERFFLAGSPFVSKGPRATGLRSTGELPSGTGQQREGPPGG